MYNHTWAHKPLSPAEHESPCKASEGSRLGELLSFHCLCLAASQKLLYFFIHLPLFFFFSKLVP